MTPNNNIPRTVLRPGTPLGERRNNTHGRYVIERFLSAGGFGNTYIAIDTDDKQQSRVVIKELFVKGINDRDPYDHTTVTVNNVENKQMFEELFNKFKNEAERQWMIEHKNVVRVYNLFEDNMTQYFVMEYVQGDSLYTRIKQDNLLLTTPQAWKLIDQMTQALAAVHQFKIYHLDIKPANVMIDLDGNVKLIDFGASKQQKLSEHTAISMSHTVMCFTPGYAPIEQEYRDWKHIGPWTDLYSLGGTVYAALTGRKPPTSGEIHDLHERAFDFTGIDPMLAHVIVWLMQAGRLDRPRCVADFRQYLLQRGLIHADGVYGPEYSLLPAGRAVNPNEINSDEIIDVDSQHSLHDKPAETPSDSQAITDESSDRVAFIGGDNPPKKAESAPPEPLYRLPKKDESKKNDDQPAEPTQQPSAAGNNLIRNIGNVARSLNSKRRQEEPEEPEDDHVDVIIKDAVAPKPVQQPKPKPVQQPEPAQPQNSGATTIGLDPMIAAVTAERNLETNDTIIDGDDPALTVTHPENHYNGGQSNPWQQRQQQQAYYPAQPQYPVQQQVRRRPTNNQAKMLARPQTKKKKNSIGRTIALCLIMTVISFGAFMGVLLFLEKGQNDNNNTAASTELVNSGASTSTQAQPATGTHGNTQQRNNRQRPAKPEQNKPNQSGQNNTNSRQSHTATAASEPAMETSGM